MFFFVNVGQFMQQNKLSGIRGFSRFLFDYKVYAY